MNRDLDVDSGVTGDGGWVMRPTRPPASNGRQNEYFKYEIIFCPQQFPNYWVEYKEIK